MSYTWEKDDDIAARAYARALGPSEEDVGETQDLEEPGEEINPRVVFIVLIALSLLSTAIMVGIIWMIVALFS